MQVHSKKKTYRNAKQLSAVSERPGPVRPDNAKEPSVPCLEALMGKTRLWAFLLC